jgi:hypothetical protein
MASMITKVIKYFKNEPAIVQLGRWNINYCDEQINKKIDLANEDHCGTCSQYDISPKIEHNTKKYDINKIIFFESM